MCFTIKRIPGAGIIIKSGICLLLLVASFTGVKAQESGNTTIRISLNEAIRYAANHIHVMDESCETTYIREKDYSFPLRCYSGQNDRIYRLYDLKMFRN